MLFREFMLSWADSTQMPKKSAVENFCYSNTYKRNIIMQKLQMCNK